MSDLQSALTETLKNLINSAVMQMKNKIMASLTRNLMSILRKLLQKILSEAELLEAYNRRDQNTQSA